MKKAILTISILSMFGMFGMKTEKPDFVYVQAEDFIFYKTGPGIRLNAQLSINGAQKSKTILELAVDSDNPSTFSLKCQALNEDG